MDKETNERDVIINLGLRCPASPPLRAARTSEQGKLSASTAVLVMATTIPKIKRANDEAETKYFRDES